MSAPNWAGSSGAMASWLPGGAGLRGARDGRDWLHLEASRFAEAGSVRGNVQRLGCGPVLLRLPGAGAAAHSWRGRSR